MYQGDAAYAMATDPDGIDHQADHKSDQEDSVRSWLSVLFGV